MSKQLALILVKAKEMDKRVPVKYLVKHGLNEMNLLDLEDEGLVHVNRRSKDGLILTLTLKGYKTLKGAVQA